MDLDYCDLMYCDSKVAVNVFILGLFLPDVSTELEVLIKLANF